MPSFRLTISHRDEILTNLMEEWDKQNKAPAAYSEHELALDVFTKNLQDPNNVLMQGYKSLIKHLKKANNQALKNVLYEKFLTVEIAIPELGTNEEHYLTIRFTKDIADTHNIPYVSTEKRRRYGSYDDVIGEPIHSDENFQTHELITSPISNSLKIKLSKTDKATKRFNKYKKDAKAHFNERNLVVKEFKEFLSQFNTSKQLVDGWPDVVDYMPAHLADPEAVIEAPVTAVNTVTKRLQFKKSMKTKRANFDK